VKKNESIIWIAFLATALACGAVFPHRGDAAKGNKVSFAFTDTTYTPLEDGAVVSGNSPLHMRADCTIPAKKLTARLFIVDGPGIERLVPLDRVDDYHWRGILENSRVLGLKSFATVRGEIVETKGQAFDTVMVALPAIRFGALRVGWR
jgi:hypothetical protein